MPDAGGFVCRSQVFTCNVCGYGTPAGMPDALRGVLVVTDRGIATGERVRRLHKKGQPPGREREAASENDRRNALPSMATTPPPNPAARSSASRNIARRRPLGSGALNRLVKASRLGMPRAGRMKPRGNPSPARPKRPMSAQPPPPHGADGRPITGIPSGSRRVALLRLGSATPSNI